MAELSKVNEFELHNQGIREICNDKTKINTTAINFIANKNKIDTLYWATFGKVLGIILFKDLVVVVGVHASSPPLGCETRL